MQTDGISTTKLSISEIKNSISKEIIAQPKDTIKKTPPVFSYEDLQGKSKPLTIEGKTLIDDAVFSPTWYNKPKDQPSVLSLNGVPILSHQNLAAIIAPPGLGKSSISEAIASNLLNPDADCLGFNINKECRGIIYIDNERTNIDVWNSFERMCKRAGIRYGEHVNNVVLAGLRSIPRLAERLREIENLLINNPCSLLLLDGAGDLVTDTNDLPQAIECRIFLREMTVKYNLSILTTLHPNPGGFKPRGHIGSEICREAECVMVAKNYEADYRIITSDFEHGKNRNNTKVNAGYKWSEEDHMFVSVNLDGVLNSKQNTRDAIHKLDTEKLVKTVLGASTSLSHTKLITAIMKTTNKGHSTAKRMLKNMGGWELVIKGEDGNYRSTTQN